MHLNNSKMYIHFHNWSSYQVNVPLTISIAKNICIRNSAVIKIYNLTAEEVCLKHTSAYCYNFIIVGQRKDVTGEASNEFIWTANLGNHLFESFKEAFELSINKLKAMKY